MDGGPMEKMRGMTRLATIKGIDDSGETQTCSVEVADGIWREGIEILQPFGFASHVPEDGALALVFAVGGDEGHLVALPVGNPSKRMGGLAAGEVGMYTAAGDSMLLKPGGDMQLKTGASVQVASPLVKIAASGGGELA